MPQPTKIRLLMAEDHELVRMGLRVLLEGTDIKIVAETTTLQATLKHALEHEVDVVLLDMRMPDGDGMTAMGRIKLEKPDLPVVIFTAYENPMYVARALALGAAGYLLKGCSRDELINAIKVAATGETNWTREELRRVAGAMAVARMNADVEVSMTKREGEILRQVAVGLTNKDIATALHISYETVKEHVQHILGRIGVENRTQAAVWAVRKGLV